MDADQLRAVVENHEKWLRGEGGKRANLVRANLTDAYLVGANLRFANLRDACLVGADLASANLTDVDLANTYLIRANLARTYLARANLVGADLAGVLHVISAGQRRDGYHFHGWIHAGDLMIRAGCRNMTIAAYREHNAYRLDDAALRMETTAILDHIEQVAKARGLVP